MGFNLMAALGGAGRAASENMAQRQLQMDKLELMDAEAATRERLTRSAERRAKREEQKQNVDFLMTVGYDRAAAAQIAKGGDKAVLHAGTIAQQAVEKGVDVSTLYSMSSSFDNMDETLTGASPVPAGPMGFNWNADAIKTIYGEPEDEEVQSLSVMLDAISKKQINLMNSGDVSTGPLKEQMDKFFAEEKKILEQMKKKANAQAVDKAPDGGFGGIGEVSDTTSFESNLIKQKQQGMMNMGFPVDFTKNIEQQFEGRVGEGYVALYGAVKGATDAWRSINGNRDGYILSRLVREETDANQNIVNFGKRSYNQNKITKQYGLSDPVIESELNPGDVYTKVMLTQDNKEVTNVYVYMGYEYKKFILADTIVPNIN
tara:strand:+ start:783 stop:1904 length:1122 start_codon:yes stop_codon:yes gene_type:complete